MANEKNRLFDIMPVLHQKSVMGQHDLRFYGFLPEQPLDTRTALLTPDKPEGFVLLEDDRDEVIGYQRHDGTCVLTAKALQEEKEYRPVLKFCAFEEDHPILADMFYHVMTFQQHNTFFAVIDAIAQTGVELYIQRQQTVLFNEFTFCSEKANNRIMANIPMRNLYSMLRRRFIRTQAEQNDFAHYFLEIGIRTAHISNIKATSFPN